MGNFKLALILLSVVVNISPADAVIRNTIGELNLPTTGYSNVQEVCVDVAARAKDYDKTIQSYIRDGGNIPLFIANNDQEYVGRFYIPDVGVDVALYDSWKQAVCDKKDSACFFQYGAQRIVADHWNQGFGAIKKCEPGMEAYIRNGNKTEKFICTDIIEGHNTVTGDLTDWDGNDIWDWNKDGITCYTCNGNSRNIKIIFFKKI